MPASCKKIDETQNRIDGRVRLKKILFATDFSRSANVARPFAAKLADRVGAVLYILNVQELINYALPPHSWQGLEAARDDEFAIIARSIRHERPSLPPPQILKAEGVVWSAVADAVKENDIDLVVIGTRGRTGVGRFVLGSQAEEILRHSKVPVYTVGPNVGSLQTQSGYMRSIIFATDFGSASLAATPFAVSLAEEFATRLTLLHVFGKRQTGEFTPDESSLDCERRLEAMLPFDAKFWCDPTFAIEHGEPWEKIIELAEKKNANLIVLGAYAASAVTNVARNTVHNVIAHAHCPVLTVPPQR